MSDVAEQADNIRLVAATMYSKKYNDALETIEKLQALIKKNKISFEKITEIKWAWDGDCGANNIAECALYDIDELEPQPPEDETCKHNWVSGDNEHVTGCQICLECKMIRAAPSEDKT